MSVPVVICDDSSFARKQVARALPQGWDVDLTYAANGREGVEAIADGKADVLFLDLTMPEMDGFEVLEYIREHDLPTVPIVISGDIQPDSYDRVMQLGAIAFIKKPVDTAALSEILAQYGVLDVLTGVDLEPQAPTAVAQEADTGVDFYDWCQEISNVAMGRAADLLASVIENKVEISIPKVNALAPCDLNARMQTTTSNEGAFIINQGFVGRGIAGETLVILQQNDIEKVAALMGYASELDRELACEFVMDVSNILVGAFLKGITSQLDINLSQGQPEIYVRSNDGETLVRSSAEDKKILAIELSYTLGEEMIHCDQLVLFTESSQRELNQLIDYAMG